MSQAILLSPLQCRPGYDLDEIDLPIRSQVDATTQKRWHDWLKTTSHEPFEIQQLHGTTRHAFLSPAVHCPDQFLLNVGEGERELNWCSELVNECVHAGQRVLVVARDYTDAAILADQLGQHRIALAEGDGHHSERSHAGRERQERVSVLEPVHARLTEQFEALIKLDGLKHEIHAREEYEQKRQEIATLRTELKSLVEKRDTASRGLKSFFRSIIGNPQIEQLTHEIQSLEKLLRPLESLREPRIVEPSEIETATRRITELGLTLGDLDRVGSELRGIDAEFARLMAEPVRMSVESVARLNVTIVSEAIPKDTALLAVIYDRLIFLTGDSFDDESFLTFASHARAWVIFTRENSYHQLARMKTPSIWNFEQDRLIAKVHDGIVPPHAVLSTEPLVDRPDIELRFANDAEHSVLVEIGFAQSTTLDEAKSFLDEHFPDGKVRTWLDQHTGSQWCDRTASLPRG